SAGWVSTVLFHFVRVLARDLAERIPIHDGLGLGCLAQQYEAKGRALAAGGDGHLRARRLAAGEVSVDGLYHHRLRIELQLKSDALGQLAMTELALLIQHQPAVAARI